MLARPSMFAQRPRKAPMVTGGVLLAGTGAATWTEPRGGYFISLDVMDGCAKRVVALSPQRAAESDRNRMLGDATGTRNCQRGAGNT